jgi:hypothetical protein
MFHFTTTSQKTRCLNYNQKNDENDLVNTKEKYIFKCYILQATVL